MNSWANVRIKITHSRDEVQKKWGKTKQLSVVRGDPLLISLRDRRDHVNATGKHRKHLESRFPEDTWYAHNRPPVPHRCVHGLCSRSSPRATQTPRTHLLALVPLFGCSSFNLPLKDDGHYKRVAFQCCWKKERLQS